MKEMNLNYLGELKFFCLLLQLGDLVFGDVAIDWNNVQ